jgi:rubrerythrin
MKLDQLLDHIVSEPQLHAKWLNTLSLMENTGAKKISRCEHPVLVEEVILKHAAEEKRHAYYLKKQIAKVAPGACPTYEWKYLLSPVDSHQYLHRLDIAASRYIKETWGLKGYDLRYASYLLVTYAIEVRAEELYPIYQDVLTNAGSKVNVKSIIAEEDGHLEEMRKALGEFSEDWERHAKAILEIEAELWRKWVRALFGLLTPIESA